MREDWLFKTKIEIERTKKKRLKRVLRVAREFEDPEVFATVDERRLKAVIVLLEYQTYIKKTQKKDKKELGKLWLLEFKNPGFNNLGLEGILRKEELINLIPHFFKDRTVTVVYTYTHPIRKRILNYKQVVEDSKGKELNELQCECDKSEFKNEELGHVCTGDLKIVENLALRELLERGPKYRERRPVDWEEIEEEVKRTLREMVVEWENREDVTKDTMRGWEEAVKVELKKKLDRLKMTEKTDRGNEILKEGETE